MDKDGDFGRLAGEAMAVQSILTGLCSVLAQSGPQGRALVENAFSYAEALSSVSTLKLGGEQSQAHLKASAAVVEQLREAALGS